MKVLSVVGARPNFMKVAPLHRAFQATKLIDSLIVHTGQHYDEKMSDVFFRQLEMPEPDIYLGIGGGSHAQQTARIMMAFEEVVLQHEPDMVLVVGDVNSTLACSLVASKLHIPVAHVEAGLRSFDRDMPEEINRIVTDSISDYLFVTEESGLVNLRREGVSDDKVFFVGNVMIDSLVHFRKKASESTILGEMGLTPNGFVLSTLHRPSNVDNEAGLRRLAPEAPVRVLASVIGSSPYARSIRYQYTAVMVAPIVIASIEGAWLLWRYRFVRRVLVPWLLVCAYVTNVAWSPSPISSIRSDARSTGSSAP